MKNTLLLILAAALFTQCAPEDQDPQSDQLRATETPVYTILSQNIVDVVRDAILLEEADTSLSATDQTMYLSQASVVYLAADSMLDTLNTPVTRIQVDLDQSVGLDGRTRSGIIDVSYIGEWPDSNFLARMNILSLDIDGYTFSGYRTLRGRGLNADSLLTWSFSGDAFYLETPTGTTSFNPTYTCSQVSGNDADWIDTDQSLKETFTYQWSGSAVGFLSSGQQVLMNIEEPYQIIGTCPYPFGGVISASEARTTKATIRFNSESCNEIANWEIGNSAGTVTLK